MKNKLIEKLSTTKNFKKAYLTILGWQDGDYFVELCNENGGSKINNIQLFHDLPLAEKHYDFESLKKTINLYSEEKWLGSANGKYKFIFDIFVWIQNNLFIYNPYLDKIETYKLNVFQRLLGLVKTPEWHSIRAADSSSNSE